MEKRKYRHEKKYFISPATCHLLRQRLRAVMKPDENGENGQYVITSLYFDDAYLTAYNDKQAGLSARKKYRIRVYNRSSEVIKLEQKMKDGDFTSKTSVRLTYEEYLKMLRGDYGFLSDERFVDTTGADFYASDALVRLRPSANVEYLREAYVCPAGNVRITFDMKLSSGLDADVTKKDGRFFRVFDDNTIILEVKYDEFIPEYIRELLGGLGLMRDSASKYVYCVDKLIETKGVAVLANPEKTKQNNPTGKETSSCS